MIIDSAKNSVHTGNTLGQTSFSIKASGKAFQILSSGLYSDKILAIVRELMCNAYDAQIAAGNAKTPIDVHLPTRLEPWFSIRDFGIGLSNDDLERIYTTYFESTKTGSNDYIGALGLGSKSPFSYSNNFEVTTYFNGNETVYHAFIGEDGFPSIVQLSSQPSSERNGLKVRVSVKDADSNTFKAKLEEVASVFSVQPNVNIPINIRSANIIYQYVSKDKTTVDVIDFSYKPTPIIALQGNVEYPIDTQIVCQNLPYESTVYDDDPVKIAENEYRESIVNAAKLHELAHFISGISKKYRINFGIGELDVSASREHLSYDKRTLFNIQKRLIEMMNDMTKELTESIDAVRKAKASESEYAQRVAIVAATNKVNSINTNIGKICFDNIMHSDPLFKAKLYFGGAVKTADGLYEFESNKISTAFSKDKSTISGVINDIVSLRLAAAHNLYTFDPITKDVMMDESRISIYTDFHSSSYYWNSSRKSTLKRIKYNDLDSRSSGRTINIQYETFVKSEPQIVFFIDDAKSGGLTLANEKWATMFNNDAFVRAIMIKYPAKEKITDFVKTEKIIKDVSKTLGMTPVIIFTSSLMTQKPKSVRVSGNADVYSFKKPVNGRGIEYTNRIEAVSFEDEIENTKTQFVYAFGIKKSSGTMYKEVVSKFNIDEYRKTTSTSLVDNLPVEIMRILVAQGIIKDTVDVHVINGQLYNKVAACTNKNVICIDDYILEVIRNNVNHDLLEFYFGEINTSNLKLDEPTEKYYNDIMKFFDTKKVDKNSPVYKYYVLKRDSVSSSNNLARICGINSSGQYTGKDVQSKNVLTILTSSTTRSNYVHRLMKDDIKKISATGNIKAAAANVKRIDATEIRRLSDEYKTKYQNTLLGLVMNKITGLSATHVSHEYCNITRAYTYSSLNKTSPRVGGVNCKMDVFLNAIVNSL